MSDGTRVGWLSVSGKLSRDDLWDATMNSRTTTRNVNTAAPSGLLSNSTDEVAHSKPEASQVQSAKSCSCRSSTDEL